MLVVNKHLPGITLYDAGTHKQICQATLGIDPHEAAFSRDGEYVFVPIYGSSGVGKPGSDEHMIHVLRTSDCSEAGHIDTGGFKRPHGVSVGASGKVYVTAEVAEAFLILDGNPQLKILGSIPTGSKTSHMFALTRDEQRAYVSNVQSETISVLNIPNRQLVSTIPTEGENQRMTLSPDEEWFVTSLGPAKKVVFFKTADNKLAFAVPIDGTPFVTKFSQDGKFLYVAGFAGSGTLGAWKINVAARNVVGSLISGLGSDPGSLAVSPFDGNVYISDQPTNKINIIDPVSWQLKYTIAAAKSPDCIEFF